MFAFFKKFKNSISKIRAIFRSGAGDQSFDDLEQLLYEADIGSACAQELVETVRRLVRKQPDSSPDQIIEAMQQQALAILKQIPLQTQKLHQPHVILIVGVNGSGKTTSIAKLANHYKKQGKKLVLIAGDTFRAAALEQLQSWADRLQIELYSSKPGSDPSSVVFDGLTKAKAAKADLVLIDTAGRLQNKTDLMRELEKIRKVCSKVIPHSPHDTILVLDATIGQSSLSQAQLFHQSTPLSAIFLSKLDSSAKGGIVLSLYKEVGVPVQWIGLGESLDDLEPFDPDKFVAALFENER